MEWPFREEVFTGTWVEVELVNNVLGVRGIPTLVAASKRHDNSRLVANLRTIYVLDEKHLANARAIVARVKSGEPVEDPKTYRSWRCKQCNELVEGQFEVCWKCGRSKAG
jgi:rubrerythrin